MMKKKKKAALTLLEIMIVIVLIGVIGSVIGFNMKGSLDEGRAFKTEQGMEQIKDILMLEVAKGFPIETVVDNAEQYLSDSGLVKNVKKFMKDGWGHEYTITQKGNKIAVHSAGLATFKQRKRANIAKSKKGEVPKEELANADDEE